MLIAARFTLMFTLYDADAIAYCRYADASARLYSTPRLLLRHAMFRRCHASPPRYARYDTRRVIMIYDIIFASVMLRRFRRRLMLR